MNKIKETVKTMALAARYSLSFCYRNCKKETIWRIIFVIFGALMSYVLIHSVGYVVNTAQRMSKSQVRVSSFADFITGDMMWPIILTITLPFVGVCLGRYNWFVRSRWNQKLKFANHREMNEHRATLDIATFKSKNFDDLVRRISELPNSWQTRIWFSDEMFNLLGTLISFVLFGASLVWFKPSYAIILFITALPMAIAEFKFVSMWWVLFQELVPINKRRYMLEKAYHIPKAFIQAKMFDQYKPLRREIDLNVDDIIERNDAIRRVGVIRELITYTISQLGFCSVIVHAIWSTVTSGTEIGTLTIIIAAARTFQGNLESIVSLIADQWNSAKGVVLIEKDFFGTKSSIVTPFPVVPQFDTVPEIRFQDVEFTYPEGKEPVLRGVNFTIKPGEKVAIVGESGNGKSTLMALLLRQYDPTSGKIEINGVPLTNIRPEDWCRFASGLTQEYVVLQRKVGEEIGSSRPEIGPDMDRVLQSAKFACFDSVVNADSKGFDAQIGTEFGGREFSGGENQRLALARVHYRGTPILVLDEPDAKLDPVSANQVMENIFALEGLTIIIITHHVSRALRCDNVIVMKKGMVVEQGTPQELKDKGGQFASMLTSDIKRQGKTQSPESDTENTE